eukprot:6196359-Pleurochrysis_carterae.AAC.1
MRSPARLRLLASAPPEARSLDDLRVLRSSVLVDDYAGARVCRGRRPPPAGPSSHALWARARPSTLLRCRMRAISHKQSLEKVKQPRKRYLVCSMRSFNAGSKNSENSGNCKKGPRRLPRECRSVRDCGAQLHLDKERLAVAPLAQQRRGRAGGGVEERGGGRICAP